LQYLPRIAKELDFELILVSNQDGLGTDSHPEANFWPVDEFIVDTFAGEGVHFAQQHTDRTFAHENAPTRKPGRGMLQEYDDTARDHVAESSDGGPRAQDGNWD